MIFPRLKKEIFEKNAKNRMRVPHAVKLHSNSMKQCILKYSHLITDKIPSSHWIDCIRHLEATNCWVDVMNNSAKQQCEMINTADHPHNYELLDYVSYLEKWRNHMHPNNFLPQSTYEDCVITCTGVVLTSRIYLKKWSEAGYCDEKIVQKRHGTDDCEKLFCKSRGANPNADAKDTNHNCSGSLTTAMNAIAHSDGANCGRDKSVSPKEIIGSKIPRRKMQKIRK